MDEKKRILGMGWLRDYPDFRDYTVDRDQVATKLKELGQDDSIKVMLKKVGTEKPVSNQLSSVDLRPWCSPIEDQLSLGSCTAHAGIGLVEYFERRAFGRHIDASRLFLYKTTRNMLHWAGDTGAYLRTTMGAMALFGVPPEEYWPYDPFEVIPVVNTPRFDTEPPAFCYAFAQSFQAITYYRLDPVGMPANALLDRIKIFLAHGLPSMFGFTVFSSIYQASATGKIPFPTSGETVLGGHAVDAVGYNDNMKIQNTNPGGITTTGALLIRNSWGTGWGDAGYGWLPYDIVLQGLAVDWWSVLKNEWVDTGEFKL